MSEKLDRVFTRFLEVLNYIDAKYARFLEEAVALEAEVLSKERVDQSDEVLLLYANIVKDIVAEELGLKKRSDSESSSEIPELSAARAAENAG